MEIKKIDNQIATLNQQEKELIEYENKLFKAQQYAGEDRVVPISEAIGELDLGKEKYQLFSKIPQLDKIVGGFREGQIIVISAQTGQGKTSFLQTLTENFNEKCLWFTYEVGLEEFIEKFSELPAFFLPRQLKQNSLTWLENRIIEAKAKYGCKVVFIDHLHYLLEMQKMAEAKSISLLIGMMMRELKKMAIRHEVIIFLVSHMKKVMYDKLPDIDDLRDSSFVGQESDIVIFLKRRKENEEYTNQATLKVAKNRRTGKLGNIKLIYHNNKFNEYEDEHTETFDKLG